MKKEKISVVMATYNGEKYILQQLESILENLGEGDEVIISDDGSTDKTLEIVKKIGDSRIRVVEGPRKGVKQNFANGIKQTTGEIIFLADQDDIWMKGKVEKARRVFEENPDATLLIHDAEVFDSETGEVIYPSFFDYRKSGAGMAKNIWKNTYIGCCMAFRRSLVSRILPIPETIEMHDQWIGVMSDKYGKSVFLSEVLLRYRRHSSNASSMKHYGLGKMLENRINFWREVRRR